MVDCKTLRVAATRVRAELRELDERIAAITHERAEIEAAPLPPDDFANLILETIEQAAEGYVQRLQEDLRGYVAPSSASWSAEYSAIALAGTVLCTGQVPALARGGPSLEGRTLSLPLVWFLFGDLIKQKVGPAIAAMPDYPQDFGLPRAARAAKVCEMDKELQDLRAKRERLLQEVRDAGIRLSG